MRDIQYNDKKCSNNLRPDKHREGRSWSHDSLDWKSAYSLFLVMVVDSLYGDLISTSPSFIL